MGVGLDAVGAIDFFEGFADVGEGVVTIVEGAVVSFGGFLAEGGVVDGAGIAGDAVIPREGEVGVVAAEVFDFRAVEIHALNPDADGLVRGEEVGEGDGDIAGGLSFLGVGGEGALFFVELDGLCIPGAAVAKLRPTAGMEYDGIDVPVSFAVVNFAVEGDGGDLGDDGVFGVAERLNIDDDGV